MAVVEAIGTDTRFRAVYARQVAIAPQFLVATAETGDYRAWSLTSLVS
jgi:hypothetical protein